MAERSNTNIVTAIAIAILIAALMLWAGSIGGHRIGNVPIFAVCGGLAFAINWLAFIPSAIARTERFYDLVGGITYVTVVVVAVWLSGDIGLRAKLVAAMTTAWALRLSTFLFLRVVRRGNDSRFVEIKNRPLRFFLAWTLQGLWVLLTASAALAVISGGASKPIGMVGIIGIAVWSLGMLVEIVADRQKSSFNNATGNRGKFINVGLWAWSRHPNYFGEITLWTGMAIVALPVLQGWQYATLISPVFVALLLIKVSGVNLLEAQADDRWGGQDDYEKYKRTTPVLVPNPFGK